MNSPMHPLLRRTARVLIAFSAFVMLLCASLPTWATVAPTPADLEVTGIDISTYPQASAVVAAPRNVTAADMAKAEFVVREAGQERAATVEILPSNDLEVVLILDTSGSMKGEAITAARKAATSFVSTMPVDSRIAVVGFGSVVKVYSPFTTDKATTVAAIAGLKVRGQTALRDALVVASKLFDGQSPGSESRRVIVTLSDGGDTASKATLADATGAMKSSKVSLLAIALATRESDGAALSVLSASTGGTTTQAADPTALAGVFEGVANSVLRQYRIRWASTASAAASVEIELKSGGQTWVGRQTVPFPATVAPTSARGPILRSEQSTAKTTPARRARPVSNGRIWLFGGLATGFGSAALGLGVLLWPHPPKRRLAAETRFMQRSEVSGFTKGIIRATRSYFQRHGRGHQLAALLERAGLSMDAPTAAVFAGGMSLCAALFGLLLGGPFLAVLLGALAIAVCYVVLKMKADRRSEAFRDQFEAALQIIINSLRSGYGISQAIGTVARETEAPVSEEFRRIVAESTLGMDQVRALESCARRMACDELLWVSQSMEVNREVGGNLAEVLTGIAETIRSRIRLARQVNAISAEGRLSARILVVAPFVAFAIQALLNPKSMRLLFRGSGLAMLILGGVAMAIGYLWTKKIVRIRY
jgi:Flp pilus assembly protein TadB/Mg-chelatase subunit ChlD